MVRPAARSHQARRSRPTQKLPNLTVRSAGTIARIASCDAAAPELAFIIATMITGYASKELVGDSIWRGLPLAKATPSSRHYGGIFPSVAAYERRLLAHISIEASTARALAITIRIFIHRRADLCRDDNLRKACEYRSRSQSALSAA